MVKKKKIKQTKKRKETLETTNSEMAQARTKIKVIGIGGGGCSIVAEIAPRIKKIDFIAANTDRQALNAVFRSKKSKGTRRCLKSFQFGEGLTFGLGTGMNPRMAELAARKEKEKIKEILQDSELCILVTCLGGGTGSGACPVFAEISRELSLFSLGIFTLPFEFEGEKRAEIARVALEKMKPNLNAYVLIPNQNVFQIIDKTTPLQQAFSTVNGILTEGLSGLIETIYKPSLINIDFADLKMVLEGKGRLAYLSSVETEGQERAGEALRRVLQNPLQEYGAHSAQRILFNITGSRDLKMNEVEQISKEISNLSHKAKVIFGISQSPSFEHKLSIALLAVGCSSPSERRETERSQRPTLSGKAGRSRSYLSRPKSRAQPAVSKYSDRSILKRKKRKMKKNPDTKPVMGIPKSRQGQKPKGPSSVKTEGLTSSPTIREKKTLAQSPVSLDSDSSSLAQEKTMILPLSTEGEKREEKGAGLDGAETKVRIKRNGLQLKKAAEEAEREILKKEEEWEAPAFLRKKE